MSEVDGRESRVRAGPRTAAVVVLLGVAVVGMRAREAVRPVATAGPLARHAVLLAVAVGAVALLAGIGVLVVLALTLQRPPKEEQQRVAPGHGTRWSRPLALLAAMVVIGATLALVQVSTRPLATEVGAGQSSSRPAPGAGQPPPAPTPAQARPGSGGRPWVPVAVLAGVAALAAAAAAGWRRSRRPGPAISAEPAAEPGEPEVLRSAVRAGERRLAAPATDPRSGIVACYAAMEQALAGAGAPAGQADTPAEVLGRIVAVRPSAGPAAGRLTALFREARYSRHPIVEFDRAAAQDALAELRRLLEEPP
jgi:Domain of unknown function (DUF4129)